MEKEGTEKYAPYLANLGDKSGHFCGGMSNLICIWKQLYYVVPSGYFSIITLWSSYFKVK